MPKRKLKWKVIAAAVALLLFMPLLREAYTCGALFPEYVPAHSGYYRVRRVWISGPVKERYVFAYSDWNNPESEVRKLKFKYMPPGAMPPNTCGISGLFEHKWWHFYSYYPPSYTDMCP